MSKRDDTKTNLAAHYRQATKRNTSKPSLLASFIKFMAWVIVIGLLLSPLACTIEQCEVIYD